jgi:hypothetical protein
MKKLPATRHEITSPRIWIPYRKTSLIYDDDGETPVWWVICLYKRECAMQTLQDTMRCTHSTGQNALHRLQDRTRRTESTGQNALHRLYRTGCAADSAGLNALHRLQEIMRCTDSAGDNALHRLQEIMRCTDSTNHSRPRFNKAVSCVASFNQSQTASINVHLIVTSIFPTRNLNQWNLTKETLVQSRVTLRKINFQQATLGQLFAPISFFRFFVANHHSTIAPYSSITATRSPSRGTKAAH